MKLLNFLLPLALLLSPIYSEAKDKAVKKTNPKPQPVAKAATSKKAGSKRAVAEESAMRVMPLDPHYPTEELTGYQVEDSNGILNPHHRDQAFQSAGLAESVKDWDHFEKDMLYMRVKNENINEVVGRYPLVPAEKIIRLKKMIAK